jgi:hypothetical protein
MMSQHLPGSDGWQLVDISDDQQRCMVRDCFHKRLHTMAADTEEPSSVASRFESLSSTKKSAQIDVISSSAE